MTIRQLAVVLAAALLLCVPAQARWDAKVQVWEGTVTIPTYPLPDQDPNPHFPAIEDARYYPYSLQDNLGADKMNAAHRAFFIENEYLKVTCLPDLGGRIYSVRDKSTDEEMFYKNAVMRPALFAMRGAWVSGGVEWNSGPLSHSAITYSPVSVAMERHDDGAAGLVIGATDQILRTQWQVRLLLHPGKAYLDESMMLYNPTDTVHTYYFWNNTAFPDVEGSRFMFPMSLGMDHGGNRFFHWPINEGKDLTYFANYDQPSSIFAYHGMHDFFGGYIVSKDRGVVQYGNHDRIGGKKAWTWGQTEQGFVREAKLTDDGTHYAEIQSGPSQTQGDLGFLRPLERRTWREWWYPVHGLGDGYEYATRDLTVQTKRADASSGQMLTVRAIATGDFRNAQVIVSQNGQAVLSQKVDLSPKNAIELTASLPTSDPAHLRFADRRGNILAEYTSPLYIPPVAVPKGRPKESTPTAETNFLAGQRAEKGQRPSAARDAYKEALAVDPQHAPTLVALAVLDIEDARYDDAIARLKKALGRDEHDGWAYYFLAAACSGKHWEEAQSVADLRSGLDDTLLAAHLAAQEMETAFAGLNAVGRANLMKGDYRKALRAFTEALRIDPDDKDTQVLAAWACAAAGDTKKARRLAECLHEAYPLDVLPSALLVYLGALSGDAFAEEVFAVSGEDEYEALEASLALAAVGLVAEAHGQLQTLVTAPGSPLAARPLPHYLLQYYEHLLGTSGEAVRWAEQAKVSRIYVFPARPEMLPVLRYAVAVDAGDGYAQQYLGNLYAALGRLDEAEAQWRGALERDGALAVAARNLGALTWKNKADPAGALPFFMQALQADPTDDTLYRDAGQILLGEEEATKAVELLQPLTVGSDHRADAMFVLVRAYLADGRSEDAIALLERSQFSNWEDDTTPHDLFVAAHVQRGQERLESGDLEKALTDFETARTYPDNLGVGKSVVTREAQQLYWIGQTYEKMDDQAKAAEAYKAGAEGPTGRGAQNTYREKCQKALDALTQ